jgi:hypothetical protein
LVLRELRDLLRNRATLTRMRSALKNSAGVMLAKQGVSRPFSNMFGPRRASVPEGARTGGDPRRQLDSTLAPIADFTRKIELTMRSEMEHQGCRTC